MAQDSKKIHCYAVMSKAGPAVKWEYDAAPIGDEDVEIQITHCGICHSDLHTIDDGWPFPTIYPLVPGHEIVGKLVSKGQKVTQFAIGDRVGLGAQCYACFRNDCEQCSAGEDCCCPRAVYTYSSKYADGHLAYGGYSEAVRTSASLVFKIPNALPSDAAAPLLCAGTTVWGPLIEHGVKAGVRIGIVGMGGLGHLAVQFASKLGAEVTVISHSSKKKDEAFKFGAKYFIDSSDKEALQQKQNYFNQILVCAAGNGTNWDGLISLLKHHGKLIDVALAEERMSFFPNLLCAKKIGVFGSILAPRKQIEAMLDFCAKHNVLPVIEKGPMEKVNEALLRVRKGEVKYRFVLENH